MHHLVNRKHEGLIVAVPAPWIASFAPQALEEVFFGAANLGKSLPYEKASVIV